MARPRRPTAWDWLLSVLGWTPTFVAPPAPTPEPGFHALYERTTTVSPKAKADLKQWNKERDAFCALATVAAQGADPAAPVRMDFGPETPVVR